MLLVFLIEIYIEDNFMNTTCLKLIALISMVIDHTGQFIPNTPEWFRWIGRLAAPIFIYFVVVGYNNTSNRKKYMLRLYLAGLIMAFINFGINNAFSDTGIFITNNFFVSLFIIVITVYLIDTKKINLYLCFIIWQFISTFLCVLFSEIIVINIWAEHFFYGALFGNIFFIEGGIPFVLLGILFYLSKDKFKFTIAYSAFTLLIYGTYAKWGGGMNPILHHLIPFSSYQWMMIAALPLLLLYNGERGRGLKYFFYFFYPIHIIILYFIGISLR